MCLEYRWADKDIDRWLEKQPDIITTYKIVIIKDGKMYSPYCRTRIKKNNEISPGLQESQVAAHILPEYLHHSVRRDVDNRAYHLQAHAAGSEGAGIQ